jgi:hypothetical protein
MMPSLDALNPAQLVACAAAVLLVFGLLRSNSLIRELAVDTAGRRHSTQRQSRVASSLLFGALALSFIAALLAGWAMIWG